MKTLVRILLTALIVLLPLAVNAQEDSWFGISLNLDDARYTPNKSVYKSDGVYLNNCVKIELLTPEARKEENCSSKT